MQLGFVIDHSRCIGCHACTVACKSENAVPLGSFRTWVKYTERGTFPDVRRSYAVLRCNQCTHAPCIEICPVRALAKREDGIVDIDPEACVGCKACMQACPYDALYINDDRGVAEKCHFCAHRTERGLAPACAVVCPTEAIVPGDFHDPESRVARMRRDGGLTARKTEAGTGPNVWYLEADPAGIDPLATSVRGGYLWANRMPGAEAEAPGSEEPGGARTTYDVDHRPHWGTKVTAYLFTKSLAAGLFLVALLLPWLSGAPLGRGDRVGLATASLVFLGLTTVLLVADLKRPERFFYLLTRPNPRSWLVRGAWVLMAFGVWVAAAALAWWLGVPAGAAPALLGIPLAALAAGYTGRLFAQARGRVLWMRRGLSLHFVVQGLLAGAAGALVAAPLLDLDADERSALRILLAVALATHAAFLLGEPWCAPRGREREFARASRLVTHGRYARLHWVGGAGLGIAAAALLLLPAHPAAAVAAGAAALVGIWIEEDILVRAGQALPIS